MSLFEITHTERAGWQQRAARQLTVILDAHRDLPIIAWTIGTAGATLVGNVAAGLVSGGEVRRVFDSWRTALMLPESSECAFAGGTRYLRAQAIRDRVRVTLTAMVFDDEGEG